MGFCSNLGARGLFSSPAGFSLDAYWLAGSRSPDGAGNPTISGETETQVLAACQPQPRQPHIIKLISQLQKPTRKISDTWIIDTDKRETRYQLVKVHQTIRRPHKRRSVLGVHWKDWCWSWNSNTLATLCEELTHWKRPWCWKGLGARGEGNDRGWDGWMASPTRWAWVWVNSGSWWWTGRPRMLWFMGSQRVGHNWVTELNWLNWVPPEVGPR